MTDSPEEIKTQVEMPTTLLLPNFRLVHNRAQISFIQVAKTILVITLLGQSKPQLVD